MSTYARVAELPLIVEGYALERLEQPVSRGTARVTTLVRLRGGGEEGLGEDVTWVSEEHDSFQAEGGGHPLVGEWTLDAFSRHVGSLDLFPRPPSWDVYRNSRRWAFESAALDLALRLAGLGVAEALGREPRPVRFVVSLGLGDPPDTARMRALLERYPLLRFKVDVSAAWDERLVSELATLGVVDTVDFKSAYRGAAPPDPAIYANVVEALPEAVIEDPALTPETDAVLAAHRDRVSWDAVIHSLADVEALPFPPRVLNMKPSRFGSLRAVLDTHDLIADRGISAYGGGMYELGVGRGQIQALASLFHPDGPNDVAPSGYNELELASGLPASPLEPLLAATGFRRFG